ncbi:MAG: flagellar basal body-associated FliL family protein [Lentisphaerae bacterium]|nr:flagellar basal body-associated FliL family protein [Lentisphaerota bacterium]
MSEESKRRFSAMHTAGTLGTIGAIVIAIGMDGAEIRSFIKLSAFLLVVGVPFFMLLGGFGKVFLAFIPDAFRTLFAKPATPNPTYAEIARYGSRYAVGAGVIGTVFGLIHMMGEISSPESMGPAIAMAFISVLYALLLSELFFPFLYRAYMGPTAESTTGSGPLSRKGLGLLSGVALLLLLTVFVMMYAMNFYEENQSASWSTTVELKPFETNVGDIWHGRVIAFTPALVVSERAEMDIRVNRTLLRDRIIGAINSMSEEQVLANDARERVKTVIRDEANKLLTNSSQGQVAEVLLGDFLIKQGVPGQGNGVGP